MITSIAIHFEWDKWNKDKNYKKHNVTNTESEEIFQDKDAILFSDIKHSKNELRYVIIGKTKKNRFLYLIFTIRMKKIRIISARDANRKEMRYYEKKIDITKV